MKKCIAMILLLTLAAAVVYAEPQTTCPVMGGKIKKELYVDVEGYRIYVCCEGCIAPIQADPQKYIEKLRAAGVELEKAPQAETK